MAWNLKIIPKQGGKSRLFEDVLIEKEWVRTTANGVGEIALLAYQRMPDDEDMPLVAALGCGQYFSIDFLEDSIRAEGTASVIEEAEWAPEGYVLRDYRSGASQVWEMTVVPTVE